MEACHLFTAAVKDRDDVIVHEVLSLCQPTFYFRSMVICELPPPGDDGRTPDGLIRGWNIKPLYLDVTIANAPLMRPSGILPSLPVGVRRSPCVGNENDLAAC